MPKFFVTRKEYDRSLPWSINDIRLMQRIKKTAGINGFTYYPKNEWEYGILVSVFGSLS